MGWLTGKGTEVEKKEKTEDVFDYKIKRDSDNYVNVKHYRQKYSLNYRDRFEYYANVTDWKDEDARDDPAETVRRTYYDTCAWKDAYAKKDESVTIRYTYYKNNKWKDADAKKDENADIRISYYDAHNWSDFDWYTETNLSVINKGFSSCQSFLINDDFIQCLELVLVQPPPYSQIAVWLGPFDLYSLFKLVSRLSEALCSRLLFAQLQDATRELIGFFMTIKNDDKKFVQFWQIIIEANDDHPSLKCTSLATAVAECTVADLEETEEVIEETEI